MNLFIYSAVMASCIFYTFYAISFSSFNEDEFNEPNYHVNVVDDFFLSDYMLNYTKHLRNQ